MKHLPHIQPNQHTEETLGAALWLEQQYWERMEIAICNGIARAFGGDE